MLRSAVDGGGFSYLFYDPFSLAIWGITIFGFVLWGRGLFCGWFCRYVCPLGAVMAIGGLLRVRKWIPRRIECGSPCQLCRVKCEYGAIKKSGDISYSECFQCLDCVTIHDSRQKCVPLILQDKKRGKGVIA